MIAKIRKTAARFLQDENGAVTVDWVVLTAAVVGLGMVIAPTVGQNTFILAEGIAEVVDEVEVDRYRTGASSGESEDAGSGGTAGEASEGG